MTLNEWLKDWPYQGVYKLGCYIVPDADRPNRWDAWHLSDYRVTCVTAGSIYLMPKNGRAENGD